MMKTRLNFLNNCGRVRITTGFKDSRGRGQEKRGHDGRIKVGLGGFPHRAGR